MSTPVDLRQDTNSCAGRDNVSDVIVVCQMMLIMTCRLLKFDISIGGRLNQTPSGKV